MSGIASMRGRSTGMDVLRLLSMFLVCLLHVNFFTGLNVVYESLSAMAVNLFGLLTGYLCVVGSWKIRRYVSLWFQVAFYSVVLLVLGRWISWEFGIGEFVPGVKMTLLPVPLAGGYWYFNAYTGLFFLIPFLNRVLRGIGKEAYGVLIGIVVILSFLNMWGSADFFARGYNMPWLACMYVVGGYFRLHPVQVSRWWVLGLYVLCVGVSCVLYHVSGIGFAVFDYANPVALLSACSVFLLCSGIQPASETVCNWLQRVSPLAFGVYLVHVHPASGFWLQKGCRLLHHSNVLPAVVLVPAAAIAVFIVCLGVDWCRAQLFRLLRVNELAERMANACPQRLKDLEKL